MKPTNQQFINQTKKLMEEGYVKAMEVVNTKPGYHMKEIKRGKLGEISKIREEVEELEDAQEQGCKIMQGVELSDLYGAIKHYAAKLGLSMADLETMHIVTERAFQNGFRQSRD